MKQPHWRCSLRPWLAVKNRCWRRLLAKARFGVPVPGMVFAVMVFFMSPSPVYEWFVAGFVLWIGMAFALAGVPMCLVERWLRRRGFRVCPTCFYDLSASLDNEPRRCPECGQTFPRRLEEFYLVTLHIARHRPGRPPRRSNRVVPRLVPRAPARPRLFADAGEKEPPERSQGAPLRGG